MKIFRIKIRGNHNRPAQAPECGMMIPFWRDRLTYPGWNDPYHGALDGCVRKAGGIQCRSRDEADVSASGPQWPRRLSIIPSAGCWRILSFRGASAPNDIRWVPFDGIGRKSRVGLNFTERGFGVRAAVGCSDRANSAASQIKKAISTGKNIWSGWYSLAAHWRYLRGTFSNHA